jgi:hypothetical protein
MRWKTAPRIILLIAILMIAITVIIFYYIFTSAKPGSILWIPKAYYVSGKIFIEIWNIGPADVTISHIAVTCQSGGTGSSAETISIPRGGTWSVGVPASGAIRDGDLCTARVALLSPSPGSLDLGFVEGSLVFSGSAPHG